MTRFLFVGDVMNVHVMCFYWQYVVAGVDSGFIGWLFVAFVLFFKRLPQAFVLDFGHF